MNNTQAHTKQEIIDRLNNLNGSSESCHIEADCLLKDALLLAGMSDIVEAYQEAGNRIVFFH